MNTITRIRIEEMITKLLTKEFEGKSEGRKCLYEAIDLAVLEFNEVSEIKPLLAVVFDSCDNIDEVFIGWSNILDDYAKVA